MKDDTKDLLLTLAVTLSAFGMGVVAGLPNAPPPPTNLGPTLARLERLERWAEEREKAYTKCIAVEKMDLTIYPVPNVGVKKVSR